MPKKKKSDLPVDGLKNLAERDFKNPSTVRLLLHEYKRLEAENSALRTERTTLQTYFTAFSNQRTNSKVAAIFNVTSTVLTAFGTGYWVGGNLDAGIPLTLFGIVFLCFSVYFEVFRSE